MFNYKFMKLFVVLVIVFCSSGCTPNLATEKVLHSAEQVYFPVNHRVQERLLCVPTAVSIVLEFYGRYFEPIELKKLSMRYGNGSNLDNKVYSKTLFLDQIAGLRSIDSLWREETFSLDNQGFMQGIGRIIRLLRNGVLVVIDTELAGGHALIVNGVSEDREVLYLIDTLSDAPGVKIVSFSELRSIWNSKKVGFSGRAMIYPTKP